MEHDSDNWLQVFIDEFQLIVSQTESWARGQWHGADDCQTICVKSKQLEKTVMKKMFCSFHFKSKQLKLQLICSLRLMQPDWKSASALWGWNETLFTWQSSLLFLLYFFTFFCIFILFEKMTDIHVCFLVVGLVCHSVSFPCLLILCEKKTVYKHEFLIMQLLNMDHKVQASSTTLSMLTLPPHHCSSSLIHFSANQHSTSCLDRHTQGHRVMWCVFAGVLICTKIQFVWMDLTQVSEC